MASDSASSMSGIHEVPPFFVRQTPPCAVPT